MLQSQKTPTEIRIHTYLLLHRVGLHSGGSSLSGWSLLEVWSGCKGICNQGYYPDLLWPPVRHFEEFYHPDSDPGCQQWHETRGSLDWKDWYHSRRAQQEVVQLHLMGYCRRTDSPSSLCLMGLQKQCWPHCPMKRLYWYQVLYSQGHCLPIMN